MACRNAERCRAAADRIRALAPAGAASPESLDLADLGSVRAFAGRVAAAGEPVDLLINNAGLMVPPEGLTADGFELQIGVNHLGHFALTGLLLGSLRDDTATRVVTVSSIAHQAGRMDFGSFRGEKPYNAFREYRQSKLANLLFVLELHRRLSKSPHRACSVGAHPGVTRTSLVRHRTLYHLIALLAGAPARTGAQPVLHAALGGEVSGGDYLGPNRLFETRGRPAPARIAPRARDRDTARRLWEVSEELTGVRFAL
jgi:NAD(P)-dependent dehydrogenase (short-subunit alcohol dehydrogenase family)